MRMLTDEDLLMTLGEVLAPASLQPSTASMALLYSALADAEVSKIGLLNRLGATMDTHRGARPLLIAGAMAALTGFITVAHIPIPSMVRDAGVAIGLPINDAKLAAAKGELATLTSAILTGDRTRVAAATATVKSEIAKLDASDRAKIAAQSSQLLAKASKLLALNQEVPRSLEHHRAKPGLSPTTTLPSGRTTPTSIASPITGTTGTGLGSSPVTSNSSPAGSATGSGAGSSVISLPPPKESASSDDGSSAVGGPTAPTADSGGDSRGSSSSGEGETGSSGDN